MKLLRKLLSQTYNEIVVSEPTQEEQDKLVKEIHNEIDGLEQLYVNEITELLNSIQIPTTNQVTKKADLMESLGFAKSNETVSQGAKIKEDIKVAEIKAKTTKERLELINKYRLAYPTDKIIPMEEFEKVINKYNLIYAPSSAYIKDVPEKNLLEIKEAKKTNRDHEAVSKHLVTDVKLSWASSEYAKKWDFSDIIIVPTKQMKEAVMVRDLKSGDTNLYTTEWGVKHYLTSSYYGNKERYDVTKTYYYEYGLDGHSWTLERGVANVMSKRVNMDEETVRRQISSVRTTEVKRDKLFISAPKSHFNLTNLSNDGKEYYETQKVKVTVTKDPIAFYLLRGTDNDINNEFVRIVSKWGTSDDQSFLDPIIQDERNN